MTAFEDPLFDRARITELFHRLGERLLRRGVVGDLYVFGGAAMALAYDAQRATRDIDAVILSSGIVLEEAHALAAELRLPQWWLNEQAPVAFDHPGLRVSTASPEHLLAMKAMAARRRDVGDLRLLVAKLGLTQPDEVVAVCARVFPDEQLPARAQLILADLFEQTG